MTVKIFHIISSMEMGGAQKMLIDVCKALSPPKYNHIIVCLTRHTELSEKLKESNIAVSCLHISNYRGLLAGVVTLYRLIRKEKPDLVHTWLYHADLIGSIVAVVCRRRPIIWSVHHANQDFSRDTPTTKYIVDVLSMLSHRLPDKVIYCSKYAQAVHEDIGYRPRSSTVINNGVDVTRFFPSSSLKAEFRSEVGVGNDLFFIGLVARYSPIKGCGVFIEMAALLRDSIKKIRFVLVGTGMVPENKDLMDRLKQYGLLEHTYLLGERSDIEAVINGLDVLVCTSYSESFGLVVAEGLACGVPVVSSDLEIPRMLIGKEFVVPVGYPKAFADKVSEVLLKTPEERNRIGIEGRRRIKESFNNQDMYPMYELVYRDVLYTHARATSANGEP